MRHLIDTDWAIHYLNGRADIVRRLDELKEEGLGLSVASLAELASTARPIRRRTSANSTRSSEASR